MDYFISRDGQKYGPYTLSDLQRYVASGEVVLTDLVTSDALTEPVAVAQVIGTIAAPAASSIGPPVYMESPYPDPPNLHWGLVLLFSLLSCGLFGIAWEIVQAAWLKRVEPASRSIYYYGIALVMLLAIIVLSIQTARDHVSNPLTSIVNIAYYVLVLCGRFSFKSDMEEHFNGPDPMALVLSGVMTFFFGGIYFQYHINDIVRRKNEDRIYAATR